MKGAHWSKIFTEVSTVMHKIFSPWLLAVDLQPNNAISSSNYSFQCSLPCICQLSLISVIVLSIHLANINSIRVPANFWTVQNKPAKWMSKAIWSVLYLNPCSASLTLALSRCRINSNINDGIPVFSSWGFQHIHLLKGVGGKKMK